jgi:quercetin dioxygenase-like cupin family protein
VGVKERRSFLKALRWLLVLAPCALATSSARTDPPAALGSTAVSWEEIQAKEARDGRYRQVFRAPTATLDELEMHVTTLPAGQAPHPPHRHPDEELIIIKEGTVESSLDGVTRRVGPGSVLFHASNQLHGLRNVGDTPAVYHVIKWNSPGMLKAKKGAD